MPNLVMIIFYSIFGAYMLGLGLFVLIKRRKNIKQAKKELKEYEESKKSEYK